MASSLFEALMANQYTPQESPFGIGAGAIASAAPALYNPYASTGSNAMYGVGAGLLAGLLGGLAKRQARQENADLYKQAFALRSAKPEEVSAIIGENPRLAPFGIALQEQRDLTQQARADKDYDLGKEIEKALTIERGKTYLDQGIPINSQGQPIAIEGEGVIPLKSKDERERERTYGNKQTELQAEQDFRKSLLQVPGTGEARPIDQIANLPKDLQGPALEEIGSNESAAQTKQFVNEQFERAKQLETLGALDPTGLSSASKELSGIQSSLSQTWQLITGKEMSGAALTDFQKMLPKATDSASIIENKRQRFMEMVDAKKKGAPITGGKVQLQTRINPPTPPEPPPSIAQTMQGEVVTAPDGKQFIFTD